MTYNCTRCGYLTPKRSNMIDHLNRKKDCKSTIANINVKDRKIRNKILKICDHCDQFNSNIEEHLKTCDTLVKKNEQTILDKLQELSAKIDNIKKIEVKPNTQAIPISIKSHIWIRDCGRNFDGMCRVCSKEIDKDNFHVGHLISRKNGGSNDISNLTVMCPKCNLSMNSSNACDFIEEYYMPDLC